MPREPFTKRKKREHATPKPAPKPDQAPPRLCIICGARCTNINPKVVTCSARCTAEKRKRDGRRPVGKCVLCGDPIFTEARGGNCPDCANALH